MELSASQQKIISLTQNEISQLESKYSALLDKKAEVDTELVNTRQEIVGLAEIVKQLGGEVSIQLRKVDTKPVKTTPESVKPSNTSSVTVTKKNSAERTKEKKDLLSKIRNVISAEKRFMSRVQLKLALAEAGNKIADSDFYSVLSDLFRIRYANNRQYTFYGKPEWLKDSKVRNNYEPISENSNLNTFPITVVTESVVKATKPTGVVIKNGKPMVAISKVITRGRRTNPEMLQNLVTNALKKENRFMATAQIERYMKLNGMKKSSTSETTRLKRDLAGKGIVCLKYGAGSRNGTCFFGYKDWLNNDGNAPQKDFIPKGKMYNFVKTDESVYVNVL